MNGSQLQQLAAELWPWIERWDCVAWIGAGLSRNAGYPSWPDTVRKLCSVCRVGPLAPHEEWEADGLIDKAEECKTANPEAYRSTLADLFGRRPVETRLAFSYLMKLPFKAYVTTNFDPLLAVAGRTHERGPLFAYPSLPLVKLGLDSHPVFYIHGLARHGTQATGDDLILARSDFESAYQGIVGSFLDQLLTYYPVLFLGCRLTEPTMHETFRRVHRIHVDILAKYPSASPPRRYALLPKREPRDGGFGQSQDSARRAKVEEERRLGDMREERRLGDMRVEVGRYDPSDPSHSELEQFLEYLCALAEASVTPTAELGLPGGMGP